MHTRREEKQPKNDEVRVDVDAGCVRFVRFVRSSESDEERERERERDI